MNLLAQYSLFLWIPVVVAIFAFLPPKRAMISAYVFAWLALPNIGWSIPGLPNYTKMSATVGSILLCTLLFALGKLFAFRFRWYDLPITVWCTCPFITSILNDMGSYEGVSACVEQIITWGLPYFVGRVYLTDLRSLHDLAVGIAIGGLFYLPLCWIEIRFSPILETVVYGISRWEFMRYGGYRPKIFLSSGLELGMWMANASLVCYQLWSSRAVKMLWGLRMGLLTLAMVVTTVFCKSTGAIGLMVVGIGILWLTRKVKRSWPVWLLVALPPAYAITRTFNLWSGREAVEFSKMTVGEERAESLQYRLNMEDRLAQHALERPIFGWGRFNRSNLMDSKGNKTTVVDGYWIGTLGLNGIVALSMLLAMMLLPMILTIRRFPVQTWFEPQVGPVMALAMVLTLTMVDFLSNGMFNPIYAVTIGGILGQSPVRLGGRRQEAEESLAVASELMGHGRPAEAAQEFHRAIEFSSDGDDMEGLQVQAEALDGLGQTLLASGHLGEAEHAFRDALAVRDRLAAQSPEAGRFRDLAIAREGMARTLVEIGKVAEAIEERKIALQIWDILAADHPRNVDYRGHRVDALNDLSWILSTDPDPKLRDPALALYLAEEAVLASAEHLASWNTLGVARYRAGDWAGAIEALERSALSSVNGLGTSFDHYFLAMAWCQLQHDDRAREWYERGVAWASRHRPGHRTLERFREETEILLQDEPGRASLNAP